MAANAKFIDIKDAELFKLQLSDMLALERKNGWIDTVEFCYQNIPFLGKHGTPSNQEIQCSLVGQQGFKSWKAFVEHLGWSYDRWKNWRNAYSIVIKYPYLRELQVSKSAITNTHRTLKNDFPCNAIEWHEMIKNNHKHKVSSKQRKEAAKSPSVNKTFIPQYLNFNSFKESLVRQASALDALEQRKVDEVEKINEISDIKAINNSLLKQLKEQKIQTENHKVSSNQIMTEKIEISLKCKSLKQQLKVNHKKNCHYKAYSILITLMFLLSTIFNEPVSLPSNLSSSMTYIFQE
ncbi:MULTISPECIES: hypothetical protein [unclassified Methylophaga]|uniref:hypothetical protein n=1 Tax=unclassified Methylophaga TaxID=2629249 RepID=UPI000C8AC794|nr:MULTISPECIES: hypothetical protein [unclassified Methylophaga]MBN46616.1 hypothetical protein [Methylophaga sp.]|tara:strand:- start:283 stop:1161 length:879 start_codon:yes stop_codon:yes gene_type:complete